MISHLDDLRFEGGYGPLEPWFDKTWKPGEIEPLNAGATT
mgnify:CR=1 FL=1|jgi:hypothetical protein